jgi:long-chain acyl-CoA synthetase
MQTRQETVVSRFWSHVFTSPDGTGVLIKNPNPQPEVIAIASPHGMAAVAYVEAPAYVPVTWAECGRRVASMMAFLRKSGFKKGDRLALLSWNCPEWVWCDLAVQSLGGISVPIYPNSAAGQVNYLITDSGASYIIAQDDSQLQKVDASSAVQKILLQSAPGTTAGVNCWDDILTAYDPKPELAMLRSQLANPDKVGFCGISYDDVATFIYTSGSTGQPKGVVLTHGNFAQECQSVLRHGVEMGADDVYLSYLPLAHVYERVNGQAVCLWNGVPAAFCKVEDMAATLKVLQPTILLGVPAVWRKIKDAIQTQLDASTGIKAKLIGWAFQQKTPGFKRWLANALVFRKIRAGLGGRLHLLMSGGAPISPEILVFFETIGLTLLQGYGLTETSGGLSVTTHKANKVGSVGRVIDVVDIRIVPEPDAPAGSKEGEIWVKGGTVFSGYWNLPAETAKSVTSDGWFKTGDLGRIDEDGYLFITGRKKRLLKTDGGKYVAPEKIEKSVDGELLVQAIVPVGDGKPYISALIFVNQLAARDLLKSKGVAVDALTPATIAEHPEVIKAIDAAMARGNAKLEHWETVKKVKIVPDEASVGNGLLTATLKVRTEEVLKRYTPLVDALYAAKR